jgi:hypothetical protein
VKPQVVLPRLEANSLLSGEAASPITGSLALEDSLRGIVEWCLMFVSDYVLASKCHRLAGRRIGSHEHRRQERERSRNGQHLKAMQPTTRYE